MGYYFIPEAETAVPPNSWATPNTHTPASAVKERGHRYYQPEPGRWCSRDPIGEKGSSQVRKLTEPSNGEIMKGLLHVLESESIVHSTIMQGRAIHSWPSERDAEIAFRFWRVLDALDKGRRLSSLSEDTYRFVNNDPPNALDLLGMACMYNCILTYIPWIADIGSACYPVDDGLCPKCECSNTHFGLNFPTWNYWVTFYPSIGVGFRKPDITWDICHPSASSGALL